MQTRVFFFFANIFFSLSISAIKETLLMTIDDIVELKLSVKPSVLKDSLLKVSENIIFSREV